MSVTLAQAYSVLFPVIDPLQMTDQVRSFLGSGGRSLLFGETADEYRTGQMSEQRLQSETLEKWQRFTAEAQRLGGPLILAADGDISAVHRLQGVAPALPKPEVARTMSALELEQACYEMACGVRTAGVNLLLSPTADVVTGPNVWLAGRTLSDDFDEAARMASAYVRGVRRAGVGSTLKHFPGHPQLAHQPATEEAFNSQTMAQLRAGWEVFRAGIVAGADAIMMGPAIVQSLQPAVAASLSAELVDTLRSELGFKGLIMTIDLDHRSVQRGQPLHEVAIAALNAGADLLLLSPRAFSRAAELATAIVDAVATGSLPAPRLEAAARAIDALAKRF
ncbi:glycoside hydrolase family 3 N-terminal domain-containing protein [Pseudomonas typographi]|uniref:glycoside hydrolase family 3 N-terminal domain-containing protein n=1 Tax=Pseudomonas typographi TaxID=2715964 RepID=UPI001685B297|nr:glycoside hydrolase family 3 N-terminal domain-containing protein [Pseudomonas typographi]MBD1554961.1 glycoside hydrolase [Pseudomonas typographi]